MCRRVGLCLSLCYALGAASNAEGVAYLAENAKKPGVTVLPSGLQYREIVPGNPDGEMPKINSPCVCHYTGKLIDGTVFDSSVRRGTPATFAPNQVIRGWTQGAIASASIPVHTSLRLLFRS